MSNLQTDNQNNNEKIIIEKDDSKPKIQIDDTPKEFSFTKEELDILSQLMHLVKSIKKPLSASPTYSPKNFFEQIAFYSGHLYAHINNSWVDVGPPTAAAQYASGQSSRNADGDQAITVGFEAKLIKITAYYAQDNGGWSEGHGKTTSDFACLARYYDSGVPAWIYSNTTSYIIYAVNVGGTAFRQAIISAIGATTFTLTWSSSGSPGTVYFNWEAWG
ncbi:MAG: hypothetical protein ACOZBH_04575 [Patescibacteria group bacterium]